MSLAPRLAAAAAAQGGPFTTAQAIAAGYDGDEIRRLRESNEWVRLRRGVYVERVVVPDDDEGRHVLQLRAVLLCLKGSTAASHLTSAVLHGVALLEPDFSLVHVTRDDSGSARTEGGVRHHAASLPPGQLAKIDELLATGAARTIIDFARESTFEAGLVAAESALNKGLTTLRELREVLAYCADWPGARAAGRVAAFASPYSESAGETMGRIAFDALGLPPPSQQVMFFDDAGFIARSDYFWEDHHTVGEFDGRLKYAGGAAGGEVLYKEKYREDRLRGGGAEMFRIYWAESRAKAPSVRAKALAAFDRAAVRRDVKRTYRFKLQPPPE